MAVFNDDRLKCDALGVLTYLLSRPDDWTVRLAQLGQRFGTGRDKMVRIIKELIQIGYIEKQQIRHPETRTFQAIEYHVYEIPRDAQAGSELCKEFAGKQIVAKTPGKLTTENNRRPGNPFTEKPATENPPLPKTESTYSSNEAFSEFRQVEPHDPVQTVNALIWRECRKLQKAAKFNVSVIGRWCKQASTREDKIRLLEIVRSAAKAGTGDPVAYITAALNRHCRPPPDPKTFDLDRWRINIETARRRGEWPAEWGPRPGRKNSLVPPELVTSEVLMAIGED